MESTTHETTPTTVSESSCLHLTSFGGGLGHLPRAIPTPPFREAWAVAREGLIGREATQLGGIPRFIRWNNQINLFGPHTIEMFFWG